MSYHSHSLPPAPAAASYPACLAFGYGFALLLLSLFWLNLLPGEFGHYVLFADITPMERLIALALLICLVYSKYHRPGWLITPTPTTFGLDKTQRILYLAVAYLSICLLIPAAMETSVDVVAPIVSGLSFAILVVCIGGFIFVLAYGISRSLDLAHPIQIAITTMLSIGLLGNVLFTFLFSDLISSTLPTTITLAGAALLAYSIHTLATHHAGKSTRLLLWSGYNLWCLTAISGILYTAPSWWKLHRYQPDWLGLLLILGFLPLIHACWLWLAASLTHRLTRNPHPALLLSGHLLSPCVTLLCALGVIATLIAAVSLSNHATLASHQSRWLNLPDLLHSLRATPADPAHYWLYACVFVPILPSLYTSWQTTYTLLSQRIKQAGRAFGLACLGPSLSLLISSSILLVAGDWAAGQLWDFSYLLNKTFTLYLPCSDSLP